MAGLNVTARNAMLNGDAAVWPPDAMSLHNADPGNGTSAAAGELTGGAPPYARQALTWSTAANGSKATSAQAVFQVPGGTNNLGWAGYWRGTTYLGSRPLDAVQAFATQGTYTVPAGSAIESLT